jgi:hypothetical protein
VVTDDRESAKNRPQMYQSRPAGVLVWGGVRRHRSGSSPKLRRLALIVLAAGGRLFSGAVPLLSMHPSGTEGYDQ